MFIKYFFVFVFAGLVLLFISIKPLFDNRLHIVFCDVGQGDGILIYLKTTQILIDGGPDSKVLKCLSEHMPFWDRKIEVVALTNPDRDHYAGLIEVLRRYEVATFASTPVSKDDAGYKVLQRELKTERAVEVGVEAGEIIKAGEIVLEGVWPTTDYLAQETDWEVNPQVLGAATEEKPNIFSLVLALRFGAFDALLTGDIEPPATDEVIVSSDSVSKTNWEVLKVPHHGSKNGLTPKMLEAVKPQVAIISNGKNNRYGHPHKEILEILERWNVRTYRTDQTGEIEVITDGKTWQVWE